MKQKFLGLVVAAVLILSGCATPSETKSALDKQKYLEDTGWSTVAAEIKGQCGYDPSTKKNPPRGKIVERTKCLNSLVSKYVLPHAAFPDLLNHAMSNVEQASNEYATGKLSVKEYMDRLDKSQKAYDDGWISLANQKIVSAAESQERASLWLGAMSGLATSSQQYRQQNMQEQAAWRASYEANRPKSVVCRPLGYGGRVECAEQ